MQSLDTRVESKVDNSAFRDRFKFVLYSNENIIIERYFRINGFRPESITSMDLFDTCESCVAMIIDDLTEKSRISTWYSTITPIKINGFKPNGEGTPRLLGFLPDGTSPKPEGEFFTYPDDLPPYEEEQVQQPYETTFRFTFQMATTIEYEEDGRPWYSDYHTVYERIWDGSVYPKEVRSRVDLTNSDVSFRDKKPTELNYYQTINRRFNRGKKDLVYAIIKNIIDVCTYDDPKDYNQTYTCHNSEARLTISGDGIKTWKGGTEKTYDTSLNDDLYIRGWRNVKRNWSSDSSHKRGRDRQ